MIRMLKRGETYKAKDGTVYVHDAQGNVWRTNAKRRDPYVDKDGKPIVPEFDVPEAQFKANPSIWVATEEEKAAVRADHLERERKWWSLRGKPLPENLEKLIMGPKAENKMVEIETKEEPAKRGRPRSVEVKG